jgi:hypothetical protein
VSPAALADVTSRGQVDLESRAFEDDDDPATEDAGFGLFGRVEWRHTHAPLEEKARVFGRLDALDDARSIFVVEEAWVQARSGRMRLRVGADLVNWTATEAFHPADVINARNLDSDLENFEKLGEPMVALQARAFEGTTFSLLYMPYRTEPIFASPRSRLSFARGIDLDGRRQMVDRDGDLTDDLWGHQAAIAVRQVLGSADLTLHALEHMDRSQPLVLLDPTRGPLLQFQTVRQVGGTYQQALGGLLLKLEGAYRMFVAPQAPLPGQPDHGLVAAGLEYGLPHAGGSESTFLLEGQVLLGVGDEARRAGLSVFQRDVLVGYRLALNDESGKELLLGVIGDLERAGEGLVTLNYQQRIGETWTIRGGVRIFNAEEVGPSPLGALRLADHVRVALTRHF